MLKEHEFDIGGLRLIPSKGGVFEVKVNGELIYSKLELERHAEPGEVLGLLRKKLGVVGD